MINAKDINCQRFEKAAFGYKQEDVDEFIKELAADYGQLQKENAEINKKLQILADKVREYRRDEEAVKDALLLAQKEGHRIRTEAKAQSDEMLNNAKAEADRLVNGATKESQKAIDEINVRVAMERETLSRVQKQVSDFKRDLFDMYKAHLELISAMPELAEESEEEEEAVEEEIAPAAEEAPVKNSDKAEKSHDKQGTKADPFRTQKIPVMGGNGELKFGQQNK